MSNTIEDLQSQIEALTKQVQALNNVGSKSPFAPPEQPKKTTLSKFISPWDREIMNDLKESYLKFTYIVSKWAYKIAWLVFLYHAPTKLITQFITPYFTGV